MSADPDLGPWSVGAPLSLVVVVTSEGTDVAVEPGGMVVVVVSVVTVVVVSGGIVVVVVAGVSVTSISTVPVARTTLVKVTESKPQRSYVKLS